MKHIEGRPQQPKRKLDFADIGVGSPIVLSTTAVAVLRAVITHSHTSLEFDKNRRDTIVLLTTAACTQINTAASRKPTPQNPL